MPKPTRILTVAAIALVAVAGTIATTAASTPAALFHTALKKSSPANNDTVTAPSAIKLWFSETVEVPVVSVKLAMADGSMAVTLGKLVRADTSAASVSAPITGMLHAGKYTAQWSVASKDGHPATGKFDFVVKAGK